MKKLFATFKLSAKELSKTKNLALCGLMAALGVILGYVATINIGQYIRIGFSTIPNRIIDFCFGPVVGAIFGGTLDILKYIINPTGPFFPGFTVSAMLTGLLYGIILYKKPISIPRIVVAEVLEKILIDCLLNSVWLSVLYKTPFWATLITSGRLVTKLVQLPVDIVIVYAILKCVEKSLIKLGFASRMHNSPKRIEEI